MLIYKATNNINGKIYVGQTTLSLDERIYRHKKDFKAYLKHKKSTSRFYESVKQHGWEHFSFSIIEYCNTKEDWIKWATIAFQSSYGYEWQGDSLLIARENLLYSFIDYYQAQFKETPSMELQKEIAEIIAWNIFQMDGLKYVIPMSCKTEKKIIKGEVTLFATEEDTIEEVSCEGCEKKIAKKHNGIYAKTMDWVKGKPIPFVDIVSN